LKSVNNVGTVSASGVFVLQVPYKGFVSGTHWGTSVSSTPGL